MGVITDLVLRVKTLANMTDVSKVKYNYLREINVNSKANYPLLLFRSIDRDSSNYRNPRENPTYTFDFYLSDLYPQGETREDDEMEDYMTELLDSIVKSIPKSDNSFKVLNVSKAQFGTEQHNDNVAIVKINATIQVFTCTTLIDQ
jgi:hypothetical protein